MDTETEKFKKLANELEKIYVGMGREDKKGSVALDDFRGKLMEIYLAGAASSYVLNTALKHIESECCENTLQSVTVVHRIWAYCKGVRLGLKQ